jgi:hypothetical protein
MTLPEILFTESGYILISYGESDQKILCVIAGRKCEYYSIDTQRLEKMLSDMATTPRKL